MAKPHAAHGKLNIDQVYHSFTLYQICAASTNEEMQIICEDAADIVDFGFTKPLVFIGLEDRPSLVKAVSLHHIIFKCKAELDQLREGLGTLGIADAMKSHRSLLEPLFTAGHIY